jgi:hypothetical protein
VIHDEYLKQPQRIHEAGAAEDHHDLAGQPQ